jgi:IS30 family transposase
MLDHPTDDTMRISYEAIYQYVYHQVASNGKPKKGCEDLRQYLPRRHTRRATKGARKAQKLERLQSLPSIETRPAVVEKRSRVGDWEDDLIVSRDSEPQVKSVNERKTGVFFFRKTTGRTAAEGDAQVISCLKKIPQEFRRTLTRDRGAENKAYESLEKNLGLAVYFAHPYCSHERGSNENGNGLLRRFFPKKTNWDMISEKQLARAEYLINTRPRKRYGYRSPAEMFLLETGVALYS